MTEEYDVFKLTKSEIDSALWKKLEAEYKNRLQMAREANDYDAPESITQKLRGRIEAYREFLSLAELPDEE